MSGVYIYKCGVNGDIINFLKVIKDVDINDLEFYSYNIKIIERIYAIHTNDESVLNNYFNKDDIVFNHKYSDLKNAQLFERPYYIDLMDFVEHPSGDDLYNILLIFIKYFERLPQYDIQYLHDIVNDIFFESCRENHINTFTYILNLYKKHKQFKPFANDILIQAFEIACECKSNDIILFIDKYIQIDINNVLDIIQFIIDTCNKQVLMYYIIKFKNINLMGNIDLTDSYYYDDPGDMHVYLLSLGLYEEEIHCKLLI